MSLEARLLVNEIVGMSLDEAESVCRENGVNVRVVHRDGESMPLSMDLNENRLNLTIMEGVVTNARVG